MYTCLALFCLAGARPLVGQTLQLQFGFEDSGVTTADSVSAVTLNLVYTNGVPTDYHGSQGSGVYARGQALDFSSGNKTTGPLAFTTNNSTLHFGLLTNFTTTLWVKPSLPYAANWFPRCLILGANGIVDNGVANSLGLLNGAGPAMQTYLNTTAFGWAAYTQPTNQWTFLALTWDGQFLRCYAGSEAASVVPVSSFAVTGSINVGSAGSLFLGNRLNYGRPFVGWMDDVRFYTGAASSNFLESVRQSAWNPAPPANVTVSGCGQASLTWSPVPGATGYLVKRATSPGAEVDYAAVAGTTFNDQAVTTGATYFYTVVATNALLASANSTEVSVTIQSSFTFVSQPASQTVSNGAAATFAVATSGGSDLAYGWQTSSDGGATWNSIAGATNASYATGPLSLANSGDQYRVLVTSACGTTPSAAATLTVNGSFVDFIFTYASTVSTNTNGTPLQLTAQLDYVTGCSNAPIMVVMHPFSDLTGQFAAYRDNAQRFSSRGFFTIMPAMRQREGSQGVRDNGGVEIYDIYDAVEAVKAAYPSLVNPTNVSITGYSGGGGNTMSALTKFPDYFRAGAAYFGMSDYGYSTNSGWYFNGAAASHQAILNAAPGNPTPPASSIVTDSYMARASNLASRNNPYTEIHLFVNSNEPTCPKINDLSFRDNALARASYPGEFTNITVHLGAQGFYQDFNGNGLNDTGEEQYWPHSDPTADQQQAGDAWYLERLLAGQIPQPVLKAAGTLFVAGYVKTRPFTLWLGDGQNAAGELTYSLGAATNRFEWHLGSINPVTGRLLVDTTSLTGRTVEVRRNGVRVDSFIGGGLRALEGLSDGEVIELVSLAPPPARFTSVSRNPANGEVTLTWTSVPGAVYSLEAADNLATPAPWPVVNSAIPSGGTTTTCTETAPSGGLRFYRLRSN